jgi:hypothetical protein
MTRDQEDKNHQASRMGLNHEVKANIDCIRLYLEAIITKAEKLQKDILHKRTLAKEIYILAENALKKLKEI